MIKYKGVIPDHQLKLENNNELSLNCDTNYLLCWIPLLSFRFSLGIPEMASYRSSVLVWFCECLIHSFACGSHAVRASHNSSLLFIQYCVSYTSGNRRRPKSHNFKGVQITLKMSPKVIGLIPEPSRAWCTREILIGRRYSLFMEELEGTM